MKRTIAQKVARYILAALLVLFVVLKLTGVVAWSWWIVTSPFWAPIALAVALVGLSGAGSIIVSNWSKES